MNFSDSKFCVSHIMAFVVACTISTVPVAAQSTVELDSFDLGKSLNNNVEPTNGELEMETCLVDRAACKSEEYKTTTSISIDDVVNLGIIDREQVAKPSVTIDKTDIDGELKQIASNDPLPSIDIEILFDYNSHILRPDQYAKLVEVAQIINKPAFGKHKFALIGHTDAKGGADYNKNLSLKRAQSVGEFLNAQASFAPNRIVTAGLGFNQLKTPADPFGASNRRVQLVLVPVR